MYTGLSLLLLFWCVTVPTFLECGRTVKCPFATSLVAGCRTLEENSWEDTQQKMPLEAYLSNAVVLGRYTFLVGGFAKDPTKAKKNITFDTYATEYTTPNITAVETDTLRSVPVLMVLSKEPTTITTATETTSSDINTTTDLPNVSDYFREDIPTTSEPTTEMLPAALPFGIAGTQHTLAIRGSLYTLGLCSILPASFPLLDENKNVDPNLNEFLTTIIQTDILLKNFSNSSNNNNNVSIYASVHRIIAHPESPLLIANASCSVFGDIIYVSGGVVIKKGDRIYPQEGLWFINLRSENIILAPSGKFSSTVTTMTMTTDSSFLYVAYPKGILLVQVVGTFRNVSYSKQMYPPLTGPPAVFTLNGTVILTNSDEYGSFFQKGVFTMDIIECITFNPPQWSSVLDNIYGNTVIRTYSWNIGVPGAPREGTSVGNLTSFGGLSDGGIRLNIYRRTVILSEKKMKNLLEYNLEGFHYVLPATSTVPPSTTTPPTSSTSTTTPTTSTATTTTPTTPTTTTSTTPRKSRTRSLTILSPLYDTKNTTTIIPTATETTYFPDSDGEYSQLIDGYRPLWVSQTMYILLSNANDPSSEDLVFTKNSSCNSSDSTRNCTFIWSYNPECNDPIPLEGMETISVNEETLSRAPVEGPRSLTALGPFRINASSITSKPRGPNPPRPGFYPITLAHLCFSSGKRKSLAWSANDKKNEDTFPWYVPVGGGPYLLLTLDTFIPQPPTTTDITTSEPDVSHGLSSAVISYIIIAVVGVVCLIMVVIVYLRVTHVRRKRKRNRLLAAAMSDTLEASLSDPLETGSMKSTTRNSGMGGHLLDGKYSVLSRLGKGSFSVVYLVERITDGQRFALKYVLCADDVDRNEAMKECDVIHKLQGHPNVIHLVDMFMSYRFDTNVSKRESGLSKQVGSNNKVYTDEYLHNGIYADRGELSGENRNAHATNGERYLSLVMEYHEKGDVGHWVRKMAARGTSPGVAEGSVVSIAYQVLSVLHFMHNRNPPIIHRDLKPENLLLSSVIYDNVNREEFIPIVVTDFGLSRVMDATFCETGVGSLPYVAPECWQRHYTTKIDIWALGCILYGICTQRVASDTVRVMFADSSKPDFKGSVRRDLCEQHGYSQQLATFILAMLEPNPHLRPTAALLQRGVKKIYQSRPGQSLSHKLGVYDKGAAATKKDMTADAQCVFYIDPDFTEVKDTPETDTTTGSSAEPNPYNRFLTRAPSSTASSQASFIINERPDK